MTDLYREVCTWIVTLAGAVVVVAFSVYFVVVICRLVGVALRPAEYSHGPAPAPAPAQLPPKPAARPRDAFRCGYCDGEFGPVEKVTATEDGNFALRACSQCQRKQMVPYEP